MKHICQGTKCHTYDTQSRVRGTKGNKVLRTRFARYEIDNSYTWSSPWEQYFCDERCMNNWLATHMTQLINYVGIKTKPSETPIDIVQELRKDWAGHEYTSTTIKFLSEPDVNDSITT
jgi:hypothetical protein